MDGTEQIVFDEDLAGRLPSLLAQLYADAVYAKSALERHQSAFYLWEATIKLMGAAAVVTWAARGGSNEKIAESLKTLARPALGHWWGYCRTLLPRLAESDPGFAAQREIVLGRARDDLPRLAGLDALFREAAGQAAGSRALVNLQALFDRIISYRNREIGHGAAGRRPREFYDRMGHALLAGGAELLRTLDPLAGRSLVYVDEIRKADDGGWAATCLELRGEWPRRSAPVRSDAAATATTLQPHRLFLRLSGAEPAEWTSFYPLAMFNADSNDLLLLNGRPKDRETEYLSYRYATHEQHPDAPHVQELLARLLGMEVSPVQVQEWAEDVPPDEAPTTPDVAGTGRSIGDFELLTRLGKGAMGVVYRARQAILGREVALKCQLRVGDARTDQRFQREIRALGRVTHPNLVRVFASGNDGDQWYYAMELVEGATLATFSSQLETRLQDPSQVTPLSWRETLSVACDQTGKEEQPLSPGPDAPVVIEAVAEAPITVEVVDRDYITQVVDLVRQAAEAAHALHKAGVVHRDIKPGNIMVSADGRQAYLMDLGLAHVVEEGKGNLTRTRQFIGSLPYASPEQVAATSPVDHRSDIYSLGATLWELLTFRRLFNATDETPPTELMRRIQFDLPIPPHRLNRRISRDLEAVVLLCLEKNPLHRYNTARDLSDDLGRILKGEPVRARASTLRTAWRNTKRTVRPILAVMPYMVAIAAVTYALVFLPRSKAPAVPQSSKDESGSIEQSPSIAKNPTAPPGTDTVDLKRSATSVYLNSLKQVENQTSFRPERFGGVEVGAIGIKAVAVEVSGTQAEPILKVFSPDQKTVEVIISPLKKKSGKFRTEDVAAVVEAFVNVLKSSFRVPEANIQIVASSSVPFVMSSVELANLIQARTGKTMQKISALEEASLTAIAMVRPELRTQVLIVTIGAGNTTAGAFLGDGGRASDFVQLQLAPGSVSLARAEKKETWRDSMSTAAAHVPLQRNKVILTGGAAWAFVTIFKPETALDPFPKVTADEIARYSELINRNTKAYPEVHFDRVSDLLARNVAVADYNRICGVGGRMPIFKPEELRSGAALLSQLSFALKFNDRSVHFDRDWLTSWIIARITPESCRRLLPAALRHRLQFSATSASPHPVD